jgi:uncharacterized membrane protein YqaE (UPF0057 family)
MPAYHSILFPPGAAAFITGCSCDLLINILLTVLGYLPGHLHACELQQLARVACWLGRDRLAGLIAEHQALTTISFLYRLGQSQSG